MRIVFRHKTIVSENVLNKLILICIFNVILIFSGFVEQKNIENYTIFREKYVNKCRNNSNFRRAVDEMDHFISDPDKYRSNAVARVIKIKSEEEIQRNSGIKVELDSGSGCKHKAKSITLSDKTQIELLTNEKTNLIAEILSLKSENQQICFGLNEMKFEQVKTKNENEQKVLKLNEQVNALLSKLKIAEAEAIKLKNCSLEKRAIDKKIIADLISEKNILTARVKQLQSGVLLNKSNAMDKNDLEPNVFEVDKVIADKLVDRTRYYLIRWKGYSSEDDTWEKPENLFCPSILDEYKKSKQKN